MYQLGFYINLAMFPLNFDSLVTVIDETFWTFLTYDRFNRNLRTVYILITLIIE